MDHKISEALWNLLFPKCCPFCGKLMDRTSRCCPACSEILPFLPAGTYQLDGISLFVPFSYEGAAEQAVWRLKFHQKPAAARHLAPFLAETLPEHLPFDCIVPIPMERTKQRKRGYNQAELLARFLGEQTGIPVLSCLKKVRHTAEQHTLNARERKKNLQGAYEVCLPVSGKRVLLCDDVITTGVTIREAARVLKNAQALSVSAAAATLAGTLPFSPKIPSVSK